MTHRKKPRVLLFTGDGKGKTTAALGMALRAVGHAMRVGVIQFIKSACCGEHRALERLGVSVTRTGLGFLPTTDNPDFARHREAAEAGFKLAAEAVRDGTLDMIVLDEIVTAIAHGLLEERQVTELMQSAPGNMVIVMTGRGATESLIAIADTVSRVQCVKHGMQGGIAAQKGVEQ